MSEKDTGRWRIDDQAMNFVVRTANKPRLLIAATAGFLVIAGILYAILEHKGPVEGVWWAVVTGFTVGYGDQYPTTTPGRFLGAALIVSMFVLALCLGAQITARLIEDRDVFTNSEQEHMKQQLADVASTVHEIQDSLEQVKHVCANCAATIKENSDNTN